jgi:hypothetical protein
MVDKEAVTSKIIRADGYPRLLCTNIEIRLKSTAFWRTFWPEMPIATRMGYELTLYFDLLSWNQQFALPSILIV